MISRQAQLRQQVSKEQLKSIVNPIVFLDLAIDGKNIGRLKIELDARETPKTAENFRQLCTGEYLREGKPVGYKHSPISKIIRGHLIVAGKLSADTSIWGGPFADESYAISHNQPGIVTMLNNGPNTNICQFMITLGDNCSYLDGKNVAFGRVVGGMDVLRIAQQVTCDPVTHTPQQAIEICECGEL